MLSSALRRIAKEELSRRLLTDGGVADRPQGKLRIDATAWAIITFSALEESPALIDRCRARLKSEQGNDGRVWVSRDTPDTFWPTALAVLAWQGASDCAVAQNRAIKFLLDTTGIHYRSRPSEVAGHNAALKGWPWVANTHSWIEPTVLGVMALTAAGYGQHNRIEEALRMIEDRQLPHGGWNYGNTSVFGQELRPMPESTGTALTGLAGHVDARVVARSLDYLQGQISLLRTPVALGWGLLGLAAWGASPSNSRTLVERCLANQSRYGEYDTSSFCLVLLGALAGEAEGANNVFSSRRINQFDKVIQ